MEFNIFKLSFCLHHAFDLVKNEVKSKTSILFLKLALKDELPVVHIIEPVYDRLALHQHPAHLLPQVRFLLVEILNFLKNFELIAQLQLFAALNHRFERDAYLVL